VKAQESYDAELHGRAMGVYFHFMREYFDLIRELTQDAFRLKKEENCY
jgi:hypothetical protein